MGTKNKPGTYDCYANAYPDEPMFILLGRDPHAPALVEQWAVEREKERGPSEKVAEARACAAAMRAWHHDGSLERRIEALVARVERDEREIGVLSTGEQIAVAVVLERRELAPAPYGDSWQDALDRLGEEWLAACRRVAERRSANAAKVRQ